MDIHLTYIQVKKKYVQSPKFLPDRKLSFIEIGASQLW